MTLNYKGTAIKGLKESYNQDTEIFRANGRLFPERKTGFAELDSLQELMFPLHWNKSELLLDESSLTIELNRFGNLLVKGITPYIDSEKAENIVIRILDDLPLIRNQLKMDAEAAYAGDPAANEVGIIVRAYPGFKAVMIHRLAHELYKRSICSYARELSEQIHNLTGIDIHPGAVIGKYFFIDHGNGVVIGETSVIGDWARLYQGVTLGALHFREGKDGLEKGYKRHPTLGSNVVIGMGAKIVGPVSIGDHVKVGANAWVSEDIAERTTVYIAEHPRLNRKVKK